MIYVPTVEGHHLPATGGTRTAGGGWFAKDGAGVRRSRDDQLLRAKCGERRIISRSFPGAGPALQVFQDGLHDPIAPREGGVVDQGLDPFDDRRFGMHVASTTFVEDD
jgi:hypothetical protein